MKGWKRNLYAICGAQLLTLIGFSSYGRSSPTTCRPLPRFLTRRP